MELWTLKAETTPARQEASKSACGRTHGAMDRASQTEKFNDAFPAEAEDTK